MRAVHVLEPGLDVPIDLGPDRRQRVLASRWESDATVLHLGAGGEAEGVANAERTAGLDLFDDRGGAAEQRIAVALLFL